MSFLPRLRLSRLALTVTMFGGKHLYLLSCLAGQSFHFQKGKLPFFCRYYDIYFDCLVKVVNAVKLLILFL